MKRKSILQLPIVSNMIDSRKDRMINFQGAIINEIIRIYIKYDKSSGGGSSDPSGTGNYVVISSSTTFKDKGERRDHSRIILK